MGTLIAVFSERKRKFFPVAAKPELKPEGIRRLLASPLRYCLGDTYFYVPAEHPDLDINDRLCWIRDREYFDFDVLNRLAQETDDFTSLGVRIGNTYLKRRKEHEGKFVAVESFVAEELYEQIRRNPDALASVSKSDFEALCAEIFVKRGFEVELFRGSGDGGIDFLATRNEDLETTIFAVQCKQPDIRPGKARRSLGRPTVQQIYGAAKAWDIHGAVALSGSTYSPQAKKFALNKPNEIHVHDGADLIEWIKKYRWNDDE